MQTQRPVIVGHRGAKGIAPENTLEGFAKAIEVGVDMIETDVQVTQDGVPVLLHKFNVKLAQKLENVQLPKERRFDVSELTFTEIRERQPDIPTLQEAIDFINRRVVLMIEIKKGVPTTPVINLVRAYLAKGWQPKDFMFNSAYYSVLKELMDELPGVERIIQGRWSGVRVTYLARKLDTPYILLDQRYIWWGFVRSVSKRYRLMTFTFPWWAGEPYKHHKATKWVKHGLYGIITDYPDHYTQNTKRSTT
jgi:glycerophosphoryl diester phosphodiesterase